MSGPLKGSPKPNDNESWESLAEDLFGVDLHRDTADDDLDDEDFAPPKAIAPVASPAEEPESVKQPTSVGALGDIEDEEEDLSFDFADEDESEEREAPPAERRPPRLETASVADAATAATSPQKTDSPRETRSSGRATQESDEPEDSFWDALNDWDEEPAAPRRRSRRGDPVDDDRSDESAEASEEESVDPRRGRSSRGRRRRGGRGGRSRRQQGSHAEGEEFEHEQPRIESDEIPDDEDDLQFEEVLEPTAEDENVDDFGAGLLGDDTASRRQRRSRPQRPLDRVTPAEEPAFEDERRPPRRRRRPSDRPRREPAGGGNSFEEEPRPRRRSDDRSERRPAESPVATPFQDVPTWEDAIGLLVHRRPTSTSGWKPDPEEPRGRPSRRPHTDRRRRRRRSS